MDKIENAKERFAAIIAEQLARVERINSQKDFWDYSKLDNILIGVCTGDGIGPAITEQAARVLEFLLSEEISLGKITIKKILGLTIENRLKEKAAIPADVLAELKQCSVILKGPTTTPRATDSGLNVESANVAMRRELDLFANVRPVKVDELGIDWTFFRENTEGAYAVGGKGFAVDSELSVDFTVATSEGSRRIIKAAFEYAKSNGKTRVTAVTKANVIKETDGKFLKIFNEVAKDYPGIETDDWYIDIMTAKLLDEKRRGQFQVMVLPNLYGDILTDEAAELQGGVGTAGSANLGKSYAMFEAIHGSAPRMVDEGRAQYADPASVMRAAAMLLAHIGRAELARKLEAALDTCSKNKALAITGRADGATSEEFCNGVLEELKR